MDPNINSGPEKRHSYINKLKKKQEIKELEDRAKGVYEDDRNRAIEELLRQGGDEASKVVCFPKYEKNERLKVDVEVTKPPSEIFMALGYDNMDEPIDPNTREKVVKKKHYR